ncbi:MAG: FadR/GntR family transcriptional regulator [Desulfobacterales bacterium]|nr:FadR/GntR family transcriptional regulator [Desulfobacterales bacterium]
MFTKIETKKKSHIAAEMLIETIKKQKLSPGDKLPPERAISKEMGLSRNTIREAISALQIMGILETRHSQGNYIVNSVDNNNYDTLISLIFKNEEDPFALIDARIAFEPGAAVLASRTATKKDILNLSTCFKRIQKAILANDIETYRLEDHAFHLRIAQITRNPLVVNTISSLLNATSQPLWQTMKKALSDTRLRDDRIKEHEAIFQAIADRDEPAILTALRTHLENSKARFLPEDETD